MELFLTTCVAAATLGLLYGLFALGLGFVLRATGQLNLAHGDTLMLATYVGLGTRHRTGSGALAVLVDVAVAAGLGALIFLIVYAPASRSRRASTVALGFLPSLGVALVVRNIADSIDGRGSQPTPSLFPGDRVRLFADYRLPPTGWWLAAFAVAVPLVIVWVLRRTATGRRLRAVADDPILARLSGLPATRTLASAYVLAGAVGGLAGALFSSYFGLVTVSLGWQATLKGFVAAVLGGIGWVRGAVFGGLALGAFESLVSTYVSTTYKDVFTYLLLIAVLVAAPRGVVASRRLRTV